jgi:hypothetical protein
MSSTSGEEASQTTVSAPCPGLRMRGQAGEVGYQQQAVRTRLRPLAEQAGLRDA